MITSIDIKGAIEWHNMTFRKMGDKKMTPEKVRAHCGFNKSKVSFFQTGRQLPTIEEYFMLLELLKCPHEVIVIPFEYKINC